MAGRTTDFRDREAERFLKLRGTTSARTRSLAEVKPMTPILTASEMRAHDRRAIDELGIPSLLLMENAARGAAEIVAHSLAPVEALRIVILCGKGNNGGDGLAIARHLAILGADPLCVLLHPRGEYSGDPATQLSILAASGMAEIVGWEDFDHDEELDGVVDALLGTGATGELRGAYRDAVAWANSLSVPRIAVDIPTGIDADTGSAAGPAIEADLTVTMGALKPGLLIGPGAEASGDLYVAHIGVSPQIYLDARIELLDRDRARDCLPTIDNGWNKYDRGKVLIIAGARGMTGAGVMSAESALRFGSGLVVFALPEGAAGTMPQQLPPEIMTRHLPSGEEGAFAADAIASIADELESYAAIGIGPGISKSPGAAEAVRDLLRRSNHPVVLDADGLNAFAGRADDLRNRSCDLVITPHYGEMARLLGIDKAEIARDPIATARSAAERTGAIVVLKGAPSIVAAPGGRVWINSVGNPGMATGGTGDVLTGAVVSLIGQTRDPLEGTLAALFLHSLAGDLAAERKSERGMTATDIIASIPEAYRQVSTIE